MYGCKGDTKHQKKVKMTAHEAKILAKRAEWNVAYFASEAALKAFRAKRKEYGSEAYMVALNAMVEADKVLNALSDECLALKMNGV
jgi:hypothetical protein